MKHLELLQWCLALIDKESDKEKFEQLYEAYINLMHYKARMILKQKELAEDAVSIALLSLAKNIRMVDTIDSEETKHYVMIITHRTALNLLKKQKREESRFANLEAAQHIAEEQKTDVDSVLAYASALLIP